MKLRLTVGVVVTLLLWAPSAAPRSAANNPPFIMIVQGAWGNLQAAVDKAAAEGYVVMMGHPLNSVLILRRAAEGDPPAVHKFIGGKKDLERELARGCRFVPGTLEVAVTGDPMVLALQGNDPTVREVLIIQAMRASTLDNKILEARTKGFHVLGLASSGDGHAAVLERPAGAPAGPLTIDPKAYVAQKGKDAVQQALAASAAAGYRVEQATAFNEMRLVLERREGEPPVEYRVLAAMRNQTLSEQINAAAAEGFSVTPGTLYAVQKGSLFGTQRLGSEYMVVMQKSAGAAPALEYFMVGARRRSTLTSEFDAAVAAGWAPLAMVIGFEEQDTLVLFERPRR
jgi:hypothetical protein